MSHINFRLIFKFSLIILFAASGCRLEKDENIDANAVNNEIRNRKPVRITSGEIMAVCAEYGEKFAAFIPKEIDFCSGHTVDFLPDSLKPFCKVIRVVCAENEAVYDKERLIYQAYTQANSQGISAAGNLQAINDSTTLYTFPVGRAMLSFEINRKAIAKAIYRKKTEPKNWFKKKN